MEIQTSYNSGKSSLVVRKSCVTLDILKDSRSAIRGTVADSGNSAVFPIISIGPALSSSFSSDAASAKASFKLLPSVSRDHLSAVSIVFFVSAVSGEASA